MAGYQAFIRRNAKISIENSKFGKGGSSAIYVKADGSSLLIDGVTPIKDSGIYAGTSYSAATGVICNLVGDITFNNWMNGKDGFFAYSSSATIPGQLKTLISSTLGQGSEALGSLLRYVSTDPTNLDKAEFNLGIMNDCLDPAGGVNYTRFNVEAISGKKPNYDENAYWKTLTTKDPKHLANIGINNKLAMASVNAKQAGLVSGAPDGMSYFVLGWLNPSA